MRRTERFCVNKGTDWDSGLAQNTEQLAHAKIAVRAWASTLSAQGLYVSAYGRPTF